MLGRDEGRLWARAQKQKQLSSLPSAVAFKLCSVLCLLLPQLSGLKVVETYGRKLWLGQMSVQAFFFCYNLETGTLYFNLRKSSHAGSDLRTAGPGLSPAVASIKLSTRPLQTCHEGSGTSV